MWGSDKKKQEFAVLYPLFYGSREERSYAKAVKIIKRLVEIGYVPAIFTLGDAYYDGKGVQKNLHSALECYVRAAKEGYPSAECAVGNFYAMVFPRQNAWEHDPEKAVKWYLRAAEQGNSGAQCNLANCYLTGLGVTKDSIEAYLWATLAVHCSSIRFRSAEVFRDQAAALLDADMKMKADQRLEALVKRLPYIWSEHLLYWRKLYEEVRKYPGK